MKIIDKIIAKAKDIKAAPPVTIAFIGDSVTQGCFEIYNKSNGDIETVYDKNNAYHAHLSRILATLYPSVPINIINAGISGGKAPQGLERLDRDVISYHPDLVVVCFGLNDSTKGMEMLTNYIDALDEIFKKLNASGIETIFMTPNMMCTEVSCFITEPNQIETAQKVMTTQNDAILEAYLESAKEIAKQNGVTVCDCYKKWKTLYKCGVDVTELLANKINHPTREMNYLFAISLLETMMGAAD